MKIRVKRVYFFKCEVIDCNNKVYTPGAICPQCLEKMYSDDWQVNICGNCRRIIDFYDAREISDSRTEKVILGICQYCQPGFLDNLF